MKPAIPIFTMILSVLLYGAFLSQYSIEVLPDSLLSENPPGYNDYKGVMNVHSLHSTGSGTVDEIVAAAHANDLDFLILNEFHPFDKAHQSAKYYDNTLVSFDGEYSYENSRVLSFMNMGGMSYENPAQFQMQLPNRLESENTMSDDLFVLAHPMKPRYKWRGDLPNGLLGLEIISLSTIWEKAWQTKKVSLVWTLFTYVFNGRLALTRLFDGHEQEVEYWDQQNKRGRFFGFAGADADAKIRVSQDSYLKFPSYKTLMGLASNHVLLKSELTGNAKDDSLKLREAFLSGNFYFGFDALANPKGFLATVETPKNKTYLMGEEFEFEEGQELVVRLPQKPKVPFDVIIYRNGKRELISNSLLTRWVIQEPGVYRVMVRVIPTFPIPDGKKWVPWIYSNPFYIEEAS